MGKAVAKKRKKKGRPSLVDLQKRSLREQLLQQQKLPNSYCGSSNSRNPSSAQIVHRHLAPLASTLADGIVPDSNKLEEEDDDDEDGVSNGKRREKKLTLVLRLPHRTSNSPRSDSDQEEEGNAGPPLKKRNINAVGIGGSSAEFSDGSVRGKTERHASLKAMDALADRNTGPGTPLPDKNSLTFILDRLQKKDTYGVFSEPVDPDELPDYHEVIEHPMDFGTIRNRLACNSYANLEQFESDVFLISSNAMHYNAPDTIYYRQARSIQELARKDFENLRQDGGNNKSEMKVVRRGRPPGKALTKRNPGQPTAERVNTDFSDATLATSGNGKSMSGYDPKRGTDKYGGVELSSRASHWCCDREVHGWLGGDRKLDKHDEFLGFMPKSMSKFVKKQFLVDENRRNTYKQPSSSIPAPHSLTYGAFDGGRKLLIPSQIGFHTEHAYARSLARFAATLGSVAWKVASKKIQKALPPGIRFGLGWIGENEAPHQPQKPVTQQPHIPGHRRLSPCITMCQGIESKHCKVSGKQEAMHILPDLQANTVMTNVSIASSSFEAESFNPLEGLATVRKKNSEPGFDIGDNVGSVEKKGSFQFHQTMHIRAPINGFSRGFNGAALRDCKMVRPGNACVSSFNSEASSHSAPEPYVRMNTVEEIQSEPDYGRFPSMPMGGDCAKEEIIELPGSATCGLLSASCHEAHAVTVPEACEHLSWRGLSSHGKQPSVPFPPDLNIRFQSPGSPSSGGIIVGSQPPDLAMQL